MVTELKTHSYTMKGKEIREQLNLKGTISHIEVEWKSYFDKSDEDRKKVYPVLRIDTKDTVEVE